jgi:hypothetical protein
LKKNSGWVTGAMVVHFLWALTLLAFPVFLLLLTRTSAIQSEPDAADAVSGLKIAAAILFPPGLIAGVAWFGLWKGKLWGWWLALAGDVAVTGLLAYGMFDDGWHNPDWDLAGIMVAAFLPLVLILLPAVRNAIWPTRSLDDPAEAVQPVAN